MAYATLEIGDLIKLKKKHPCGSDTWQVVRVGADIGLKCLGCNRYVLIARDKLRYHTKQVIKNETDTSN